MTANEREDSDLSSVDQTEPLPVVDATREAVSKTGSRKAESPTTAPEVSRAAPAERGPMWWAMAVATGLAGIGAFAPWMTVAQVFEISGTSREGWFVVALVGLVLASLIFGERAGERAPYWTRSVALAGGIAIAVLGAYDWMHLDTGVADLVSQVPGGALVSSIFGTTWANVVVQSAWGVWLVTVAGGCLAIAALASIVAAISEPTHDNSD